MVQVDIFWSFALGAGFAASAARQLKTEDKPFESKYFVKTLLYLSIFFVPSGATLLWGFPEWETMQAGTYKTIPAWLVMLFTMTNITQGILGYWLVSKLIRRDNFSGAWLLMTLGYFCMFFILVHGWDGTGYQRFFYSCTDWGSDQCAPWSRGNYALSGWLKSPVAVTLYAMGVVMLPLLFYWMSGWIKAGYQLGGAPGERAAKTSQIIIVLVILRIVFVHTLGSAIVASLLIHGITSVMGTAPGWILGILAFAILEYFIELRGLGLLSRDIKKITLQES